MNSTVFLFHHLHSTQLDSMIADSSSIDPTVSPEAFSKAPTGSPIDPLHSVTSSRISPQSSSSPSSTLSVAQTIDRALHYRSVSSLTTTKLASKRSQYISRLAPDTIGIVRGRRCRLKLQVSFELSGLRPARKGTAGCPTRTDFTAFYPALLLSER